MTLQNHLVHLSVRAETSLNQCRTFLEAKLEFVNGELVWVDQPDKGRPYLGTYGASCAAVALMATGARQDDPLTRQLLQYLCNHQLESGGWTIRNADPVGLTTACAFTLIAFNVCGIQTEQEKQAVVKGLDWLIKTAKPHGWPFYEGGSEVSTGATALAVRALSQFDSLLPPSGVQILRQACHSLEQSMAPEGWWPSRDDSNTGSVAVTSHVLISLIQSGYHVFTEPIVRGSAWLRKQRNWAHDNTDSFFAHKDDGSTSHILYVHFTPALVLQALLDCETDIVGDEAVLPLVEHLLEAQSEYGEWRSPQAPKQTPSWMEMDGALALSKFIKAVSAVKPSLMFREEIVLINSNLNATTLSLNRTCEELEARMRALEENVQSHTKTLRLLDPTLALIRRGLPYLLILFVVLAYMYIRPHIQDRNLTDVAAIIVSAILVAISFIYQLKAAPKSDKGEKLHSVPGDERNKELLLAAENAHTLNEPLQKHQLSTRVRSDQEVGGRSDNRK